MWHPVCDVFKEESEENSMSKNLIPIIAKLFGVEIGEEFEIQGEPGSKYRLNEDELEVSFGSEWIRSGLTINALGNIEIIKLPFEPKHDEKYWTYNIDWQVDEWTWMSDAEDYCKKACGCVFRTEEEAIKARPAKYKELTGKEWEND